MPGVTLYLYSNANFSVFLIIIHDSLPTKKKLIHKGMMIDPFCPRCGNADEDLNHVFKECIWAKKVWFQSPLGVRLEDCPLSFIS